MLEVAGPRESVFSGVILDTNNQGDSQSELRLGHSERSWLETTRKTARVTCRLPTAGASGLASCPSWFAGHAS